MKILSKSLGNIFSIETKDFIKMNEMYYLVNEKKYYDNYMIRQRLQISKAVLQGLMKRYEFKTADIVFIQNKKLYSIDGFVEFANKLVNDINER